MKATRRLEIELPEDMAQAVSARVASGDFASESEVIREGLRLLAEQEAPLEDWEREVIAAGYDAWRENPGKVFTVEEVRTRLAERRREHL